MVSEQSVLESIAREIESLPGQLGFYYKNLSTGLEYGVRAEDAYLAASVIKLPLLVHVLRLVSLGALSLDARLSVRESDKVPGCGALSLFSGEMEADIRSLCRLMIGLSDNTATNVLIRCCSIPAVNETFQELGFRKTVLRRLLFDAEASARGLENTISPREMGWLLEALYQGSLLPKALSRLALDLLLEQQIGHKLDGKLQGEVPIAHKTGEDTKLSNDVGLFLTPEPFVLCCAGYDTDCYLWEDLIRRSAFSLVRCQTLP